MEGGVPDPKMEGGVPDPKMEGGVPDPKTEGGVPDPKTEGGVPNPQGGVPVPGKTPDQRSSAMAAAIGSFKDWSNYLLVTTVAALGWVANSSAPSGGSVSTSSGILGLLEVAFLAGSAIFGILTLSLVPIVTQNINEAVVSIYDVRTPFRLFYVFGKIRKEILGIPVTLKLFCWPQHALLILAIALHVIRYLMGDLSQVLQPHITPAVFEAVHHVASVGY
jgi:hypothetical protein